MNVKSGQCSSPLLSSVYSFLKWRDWSCHQISSQRALPHCHSHPFQQEPPGISPHLARSHAWAGPVRLSTYLFGGGHLWVYRLAALGQHMSGVSSLNPSLLLSLPCWFHLLVASFVFICLYRKNNSSHRFKLIACFNNLLDLKLMKPCPSPHDTLRWIILNVHPKEAHLQIAQGEGIFWVPGQSRLISSFQALLFPSFHYLIRFFHPLQSFPCCCWMIYWVTSVSWLLISLKNEVLMSKQQLQLVFSSPVGLGVIGV